MEKDLSKEGRRILVFQNLGPTPIKKNREKRSRRNASRQGRRERGLAAQVKRKAYRMTQLQIGEKKSDLAPKGHLLGSENGERGAGKRDTEFRGQ